jgi:hypothetical protein
LLQDTNRLGEAEPLMRRALRILRASQRDTGYAPPHLAGVISTYTALLVAMGRSKQEIEAAVATVRREVGLDQS